MIKRLYSKLRKRFHLIIDEKSNHKICEQDIVQCLRLQGFKLGDHVMVHSALSSIGFVEGGPETVVSALQRVVGPKGLLVMPSLTASGITLDYVKKGAVFSLKDSPSRMGAITEVFRLSPDVFRSMHPTHSLTAWGNEAESFISGHQRDGGPFGPGTPYEKIKSLGFKVILIGVDFENMTACRIIEDLEPEFPLNPYVPDLYPMKVLDELGRESVMSIKVHNPEYSKRRKNMILYPYMKQAGLVKEFSLGKAPCRWVFVDDVYQTQLNLWKKNIFTYKLENKD